MNRRLLQPLTFLYRGVVWVDRRRKERHPFRSQYPLLSVGNISSGGTGKTQLVGWLMDRLQSRWPVIVLSRGYGRTGTEPLVLRAGMGNIDPSVAGDEPALLHRRLRNGAVGVASDRARLLHHIEESGEFPNAVAILDDGFQHWRIARDLDIVIVDDAAIDGHLIPVGNLREGPDALSRADVVVATSARAEEFALRRHDCTPVVRLHQTRPRLLVDGVERNAVELGSVVAVAGIARPERLLRTLQEAGVAPVHSLFFRDHVRYGHSEIASINSTLRRFDARYIVTTTKDAVKLARIPELVRSLCLVEVDIRIDREEILLHEIDYAIRARRVDSGS